MFAINLVYEGQTDGIVLKSILQYVGIAIKFDRKMDGQAKLLQRISKFNEAAQYDPWLIVIDLDQTAPCAGEYVKQLIPIPSTQLRLRIAVRAIEAWIMADREHFAKYLNIPINNVPDNPDQEPTPKTTLLNLVKRSKKSTLKEDMLPRGSGYFQVGPGYVGRIDDFINHAKFPWRPEIAAQSSNSLRRCLLALQAWREKG